MIFLQVWQDTLEKSGGNLQNKELPYLNFFNYAIIYGISVKNKRKAIIISTIRCVGMRGNYVG